MTIFIDNHSGTPIYDQIFTQIKGQILSGEIREDEALPSIRSLARDLRISVITTKRAYEELERSGLIYTLPGKGSFAAGCSRELIREEQLRQLEDLIQKARELARSCGLSREELEQMLELTEEGEI